MHASHPLVHHAVVVSADRSVLTPPSPTAQRLSWLWEGVADRLSVVVAARGACPTPAQGVVLSERTRAFGACARTPWGLKLRTRKCAALLDDPHPTLLIAQDPLWRAYAAQALRGALSPLPAFVVEAHDDYASPYHPWSGVIGKWLRRHAAEAFAQAGVVRVVSQRVREGLAQKFGVARERMVLLPVWMDIGALESRLAQGIPSLHERYPHYNFIIAWVGRLMPEKGAHVALEAFAHLLAQDRKAGLVIVGDGPERAALEQKARSLGISHAVVFAGWQDDAFTWIAGADAFLLSSWHEGFARVLVEAAIARKPIVATDVGIVGEILRPQEEEVFVAAPGDAAGLAAHLTTLLRDHRARRLLAINAYERVRSTLGPLFAPDRYRAAFAEYVERALFS